MKFDPSDKHTAEYLHQKKKAATPNAGRSRSLKTILVSDPLASIPRGKIRKKLDSEGRIKTIHIQRSMTSTDVREVVKNCFSGFNLESFKYLRANGLIIWKW